MEQRLIDFIAGLRASGVRVSIAESQDAFNAIRQVGVMDRSDFQAALRSTLIKEARDRPTFDELFPLYFGSEGPPLQNLTHNLSPEEEKLLAQALRVLLEQMRKEGKAHSESGQSSQSQGQTLMQLLKWLLQGQNSISSALEEMAQQMAQDRTARRQYQRWQGQHMMRRLGMQQLDQLMKQLAELLAQMGMSQKAIEALMEGMEANREALVEQVAQRLGAAMARQRTENYPERKQDVTDLMRRPFQTLTDSEADLLRQEVRRLAAKLRSRAALRRKQGKRGTLDVKKIIRANLRYGGIPLILRFKTRHQKPKLLLVCDVSTSMRAVVEFLLRLIYELQDQVASARTFAFIDDLQNISQEFAQHTPQVAIDTVLTRMPPGHYNTDLGHSLNTLINHHTDAIDRRTTVLMVGDARNNYNNPRLDLVEWLQRRSKRLIWFNPEPPDRWGRGDSDMLAYLPYADGVHRVSNLTELTTAVDKLLALS